MFSIPVRSSKHVRIQRWRLGYYFKVSACRQLLSINCHNHKCRTLPLCVMFPLPCPMCSSQLTTVAPPPCLRAILYSASPLGLTTTPHFGTSSHNSLGCQPAPPNVVQAQPCRVAGSFVKFESLSSKWNSISGQSLKSCDVNSLMKSTAPSGTRSSPFPASFSADNTRSQNSHGNGSKAGEGRNKRPEGDTGDSFQWRKRADKLDERISASFRRMSRGGSDGEDVQRKTFSREAGVGSASSGAVYSNARGQEGVTQRPTTDGRSRYRERWADKESHASIEGNNGTYEDKKKKKKPPKIREQVQLLSPVRKSPHIAILGGGMSGLICAVTLQERGIRSTVFDTGKHGLGGRMGTRHVAQLNGLPLLFDHAAQYFTVTDPRFGRLVNEWIAEGAVKEWDGVLGTLEKAGKFSELAPCNKYIATNGMRLLADHIVSKRQLIEVKRPCWINRMDELNGMWHLTENGKFQGDFDMVVIAHNGKCANRLLSPAGVPFIAKQMKRLELSSIWALLAAFEEPLPPINSSRGRVQLDGAFVRGMDSLSWVGNNTTKLQPLKGHGHHCWTFFSTAAYGKKHKVPQESIPTVKVERVKREMLQNVESAFGLAEGSLPAPFYTKVQLWGAALPVNTPNVPCIFDAYGRVGICGDWLLGSSLESAALSGMAMANHISGYCDRTGSKPEDFNVGLNKEFTMISGHDIGQFPGQEQESPVLELLSAA